MIDSRIFPLLETLAANDLDWIVIDVMGAIEMGDSQLESDDAVSLAQERVRQNEDFRYESEGSTDTALTRQWTGDEQVTIAAELVVKRVKETLHMAWETIEVLSNLTGVYQEESIDRAAVGLAFVNDAKEPGALLDARALEQAFGHLDQLRLAVEEWKAEMLGGPENL